MDVATLSDRDRITTSANAADYSYRNYVAYNLYAPLYLAGPIVTFNEFISQLRYPPPSLNLGRTTMYCVRFFVCFLCMEVMLHYIYAIAIFKADSDWKNYSPFELSMLVYFNLTYIWLKLLIPWRFFRAWALLDGVDPPENMIRCMSDNYSALAFWRSWHRSFGRWTMRYIYIPLGGSSGTGVRARVQNMLNYIAVFSFVAIWHDINLRLLAWGWLVTLFLIPEISASQLFPRKRWEKSPELYRLLCGIGAVGNILMMMAAALVGFAVGLDGVKNLIGGIAGSYAGLAYLLLACGALFVGTQVMFELRQHEMRKGINLRC